jgi:hypothetical protein
VVLRTLCLIVAVGLTLSVPAQAQFGLMLQRNGVELTADDMSAVRTSVGRVLAAQQVGGTDQWKSPMGLAGQTTLLRTFTAVGSPCGEVKIEVQGETRTAPYELKFCRTTEGRWAIAP